MTATQGNSEGKPISSAYIISVAQEEGENNNRNITKFSIQEKKENAITYESLIVKPNMKITSTNAKK